MNNETVDIHGAAEKTGLKESTLRVMRHHGYGPPSYKIGSRLLYRVADLERWMEKRYQETVKGDIAVNS